MSEAPEVRPNLLALTSVACGALGITAMTLGYCLASVSFVGPLFGVLGILLAIGARRQAKETGFGRDYAWWGLVLGAVNLSAGTLASLVFVATWMN